ncbi:MAG TPA: YcjF family protein, partial [Chroococcidiopsis sp.]
EVQTALNRLRRDRALPLIEQAQWIAAAAAFANPVPSLDLVATAAINAQLVVDLGAIYQQSFSIEQGKVVAGNLAGQMVKLGLVEITSQAIAPLLKSHAVTYVAGGVMQGLSAAYLTRMAGLCLVEYFEERSLNPSASAPFQLDRLIQSLKAVFQANQRTAFLQTLVKQGLSRLVPDANALSTALPAASS